MNDYFLEDLLYKNWYKLFGGKVCVLCFGKLNGLLEVFWG